MNILSVDPGYKGALVLLNESGILEKSEMPISSIKKNGKSVNFINESLLLSTIEEWNEKHGIDEVVIEKQKVIAGQGLISSGKIKEQFGFLKGLFRGLKYKFTVKEAKEWQKIIPEEIELNEKFASLNIKTIKKKSLSFCQNLYPDLNLFTKHGRVLDGISDAANMGFYFLEFKLNEQLV